MRLLPIASLITAAAIAAPASAHELRGYVSPSGVEFIEEQIPTYVPDQIALPPLGGGFACVDVTQRDTIVELDVDELDLSMPDSDTIRVDLTLSGVANGTLDLDGPYLCLGSAVCSDNLVLNQARAVVEFKISVENGQPKVSFNTADLILPEDNIDVTFDDCAIDGVLSGAVGWAKGWIIDWATDYVQEFATTELGPMVEGMLSGFTTFNGKIASSDFAVALEYLDIETTGMVIGADVDLTSQFPVNECLPGDPGEPKTHNGAAPSFESAMQSHLGLAINLGLVDDALYHVWRRGLTCITGDHLEQLGIELDLDAVAAILPGFPAGTELSLEVSLEKPPRVSGSPDSAAQMSLTVDGIVVDLIGTLPDGSEERLHIELDVSAQARVALDPATRALTAQVIDATISRMDLDEPTANTLGFDTARLINIMHSTMLPAIFEEMGEMPVTGSMFAFADYAIILRNLDTTTPAFLNAEVDLFRAPADDTTAPDTTILSSPDGISSPKTSRVRIGGVDSQIPAELLRYQITVDGVARPLTAMTEFTVGEAGVTKVYQVAVAAVDLNNNTDPSPEVVDMHIDGIAPAMVILGDRARVLEDRDTVDIQWSASDDLSAAENLHSKLMVYKLKDPTDPMTAKLVEEIEIGYGQTTVTFDVDAGNVYRAEIHVTDEAGNSSASSVLFDVGGAGCGCEAGGAGNSLPLALGFFLAMVVLGRRRRQS